MSFRQWIRIPLYDPFCKPGCLACKFNDMLMTSAILFASFNFSFCLTLVLIQKLGYLK